MNNARCLIARSNLRARNEGIDGIVDRSNNRASRYLAVHIWHAKRKNKHYN